MTKLQHRGNMKKYKSRRMQIGTCPQRKKPRHKRLYYIDGGMCNWYLHKSDTGKLVSHETLLVLTHVTAKYCFGGYIENYHWFAHLEDTEMDIGHK
jgi:hypothetical protein